MGLADIVSQPRVRLVDAVTSKKRALEALAETLTQGASYLTASEILNGLIAREKLGSTGIGDGIAIPHARLRGTQACLGALIRLSQPVAFAAADETPVDLIFGLIVPETATQAHLELLRWLAELFSEEQAVAELREAADAAALYRVLLDHGAVAP